jgi:hypothetical protein
LGLKRAKTRYDFVLAIAEKRASMHYWRYAKSCICSRASWIAVAMSASRGEHGLVGNEKLSLIVVTCMASMPPLKAHKDTISRGK